jgi:hypothetical protein
MIIDDGKGKGVSAQVDSGNRLGVSALTETQAVHEAHLGNVFAMNTGIVALTTTASYTGIMYIKNDSPDKVVKIDLLRLTASAPCNWRFIKSPTTGTLITAGTLSIPENTRFDSGNSYNGVIRVGSDAQTVTDGATFIDIAGQQGAFADIDGIIIITPQTSFAILVQPSVACNIAVGLFAWQSLEVE